MTMPYLPEELMTKILLWLPLMCLVRFKCVCKSWYSLLSSPEFISKSNLLFGGDPTNQPPFLIKYYDTSINGVVFSWISPNTLEISVPQDLPLMGGLETSKSLIFTNTPCNGLICFHSYDSFNRVLWNPSTSETKVLPEFHAHCPPGAYTMVRGYGFAFDSTANDFKVLRILEFFLGGEYYSPRKQFIEIYNVRTDTWRMVGYDMPGIIDRHSIMGTPGYCHWWGIEKEDDHQAIISFEVSTEVFTTTIVPDEWAIYSLTQARRRILPLNESIILVATTTFSNDPDTGFDIWVLMQLGVKESWTKLFSIAPLLGQELSAMGISRNGKLFVQSMINQELLALDLKTQDVTCLRISGGDLHMAPYVGSAFMLN